MLCLKKLMNACNSVRVGMLWLRETVTDQAKLHVHVYINVHIHFYSLIGQQPARPGVSLQREYMYIHASVYGQSATVASRM